MEEKNVTDGLDETFAKYFGVGDHPETGEKTILRHGELTTIVVDKEKHDAVLATMRDQASRRAFQQRVRDAVEAAYEDGDYSELERLGII